MLHPERLKQEGEIFKIRTLKGDLTEKRKNLIVLREDRSSLSGTYLLAYLISIGMNLV